MNYLLYKALKKGVLQYAIAQKVISGGGSGDGSDNALLTADGKAFMTANNELFIVMEA